VRAGFETFSPKRQAIEVETYETQDLDRVVMKTVKRWHAYISSIFP
jgi:hypothetical protein